MEQLSLFDFPEFKITKPIRLIELFAGVGSQAMALRNIGADFEHYRVCEFDKFAIRSYNAIHKTDFETSDVTKITGEWLGIKDTGKYDYILTYSFCCQDLSLAGKRKGMSKGSGTRSGLLWEVERLLYECKELAEKNEAYGMPQVLLMENVPQVHSEVNMPDFEMWMKSLRSLGYQNFYKDLNAKDYGVPQNRNRCFMFSFYSSEMIDYSFPEGVKLEVTAADYLEEDVDDKYFLSEEVSNELMDKVLQAVEK